MESLELGINVDTSKVEAATMALQQLAHAADMARGALQALGYTLAVEMMVADPADEPAPEEVN